MTINLNAPIQQVAEQGRRTLRQIANITGSNPYATGGDTIDPNDLRMGRIMGVFGATLSNGTTVLTGWWNPTTEKLLWFTDVGVQVTNGTDLSGYTGTIEFVGV